MFLICVTCRYIDLSPAPFTLFLSTSTSAFTTTSSFEMENKLQSRPRCVCQQSVFISQLFVIAALCLYFCGEAANHRVAPVVQELLGDTHCEAVSVDRVYFSNAVQDLAEAGPCCDEFASSPHACFGSLRVLSCLLPQSKHILRSL